MGFQHIGGAVFSPAGWAFPSEMLSLIRPGFAGPPSPRGRAPAGAGLLSGLRTVAAGRQGTGLPRRCAPRRDRVSGVIARSPEGDVAIPSAFPWGKGACGCGAFVGTAYRCRWAARGGGCHVAALLAETVFSGSLRGARRATWQSPQPSLGGRCPGGADEGPDGPQGPRVPQGNIRLWVGFCGNLGISLHRRRGIQPCGLGISCGNAALIRPGFAGPPSPRGRAAGLAGFLGGTVIAMKRCHCEERSDVAIPCLAACGHGGVLHIAAASLLRGL